MQTKFGGGRSTCFCFIYENIQALKTFEPKYRKIRMGVEEKDPKKQLRRQKKETKNRIRKLRGKDKYKKATSDNKKKKRK